MANIQPNEIDTASLQRLAVNFYREALRGNIDFGGGTLPPVTEEQIEDAVAAMIAAGTQSGVVITYDDAAGSLSFNVTAGGDLSGLSTNAIPVKGTNGDLEDSGLQRLSDGTILAPRQFGVESGSVDFGDLVRLSESSGFLSIQNKATGLTFNLIDHLAPSDGASSVPRYLHLTEAENDFVIFSDDTEMITATDITMQYTTQLLARTNAFKLRSSGATTNVRFAVTDVDSGVVVKYFPSKAAWLSGTGGVDLVAGENTLDLGDTPLVLDPNRALNIEFEADASTLLGDADTTTPFLAAVVQRGEFRDLSLATADIASAALAVSGSDLTLTLNRGAGQTPLTASVTLPSNGGGTTPDTSASITRFGIQGQATSVEAPFSLTGSQTFTFNVNHPEDINGNLELRQGGTVLRSDIDPTTNSFTHTINAISLNNNQEAVFSLRGTTNEGILLNRVFTIRAHAPAERLFYGLSNSNNPAAVDTTDLTTTEAGVDNTEITTGTTTAGQYYIVLVPNDHDVVSITDELGQNVTNIFTRTADVRVIDSVTYLSYVFGPVNAGASESYTLRY